MKHEPIQPGTEFAAGVVIAVLMPHAPVLVPVVGGERLREVASTVRALREAARRVVAANPQSLVAVSPHSPRQPGAFGVWTGQTLRGSLEQFGAAGAAVNLPIDRALSAAIVAEANARELAMWEISGEPLDHGAVVPLWFLGEAGWRGPTVLFGLNYPGEGGLRELGEAIAAATANWDATGHEVLSYEGPFGVGYGVAVLIAREPAGVGGRFESRPERGNLGK